MNPTNGIRGHLVLLTITAAGLFLINATGYAASMTFNINANGIKEVNSSGVPSGDPDGSATGTIMIDDGTGGTTGFAVFNLTLANLDTPFTAHHFHQAPVTTTGGVFLSLGNPETLRTGNTMAGTVSGLSSSSIDAIMSNPGAFYYNLHNNPFPAGAVRDQLAVPEPSTIALGALGALAIGFFARRNRTRANRA